MVISNKTKVGRNDPCPCGSGKKFKKCCLNKAEDIAFESDSELRLKIAQLQARQQQIQKQQGLGRTIISMEFQGYRFVAAGSRLYHSKQWKTFHDFLFGYLKLVLGKEWGEHEFKKPFNEQHPILQWYKLASDYMKQQKQADREVNSAPMTGAIFALINLAYNLYLLEHNVKIQERLLGRLKNKDQFQGSLYETYVAAIFIRAGFQLVMEDEDDSKVSHCEFTAIAPKSNEKYSLEAKARQPHKDGVGIGRQLGGALKKNAQHKRVVFIDVNTPNLLSKMPQIIEELQQKETTLKIDNAPAPAAYIFVTNHSYAYDLEGCNFERIGFAQGFKIDDFKVDSKYTSLKEARLVRAKHNDMDVLIKSIREHNEIPVTFDGEIPEFAFDEQAKNRRLLIGNKYTVLDQDRNDVVGVLETATVVEQERVMYGAYRLENGKRIICTVPLTDDELRAYKKYPDTFFGVPLHQGRKANDPLELYDFFYEAYKKSSREKLLSFLKERTDIEELKKLNDEELLVTCCEGWVYSAIKTDQPSSKL